MARIVITPERVREVANQFRQSGQQSQEIINRLESTLNSLYSDWEGMSEQRFMDYYNDSKSIMQKFVELMEKIAQELTAIAERFAAADGQ